MKRKNVSIDKCSGPECPCRNMKWQEILSKFGPNDEVTVGIGLGRPPAGSGSAIMMSIPRQTVGPGPLDAAIMSTLAYQELKRMKGH